MDGVGVGVGWGVGGGEAALGDLSIMWLFYCSYLAIAGMIGCNGLSGGDIGWGGGLGHEEGEGEEGEGRGRERRQ